MVRNNLKIGKKTVLAFGIRRRDSTYINFPLSVMSATEDVDLEIDREPYVKATLIIA